MGHAVLAAGRIGAERELARERDAFGVWVGVGGSIRSGYVPLMPVPPWDVSYDIWAMGTLLDMIQNDPDLHACVVVS
eukprot:10576264-Alexandrium_andersonii.AAC.1